MNSESLRKNGGVGMEFTGTEGEDARNMGSTLAKEHPPHVTGTNSLKPDINPKANFGKLGNRGITDGSSG